VKAGDKQLTGRVVAATDDTVSLEVDGQRRDVALPDLGPGRVQVEFTRLAELADDEIGELTDGDETDGDETDGDEDTKGDEELEDEA
jgi:ribosome maturation factor RimP